MQEPQSMDWQATLNSGEIIDPVLYRMRVKSPWACLKEKCDKEGKWLVNLEFRYGQVRYPLGANADGYWMAGSVQAVMGKPELRRYRVGVGRVDGDEVLITWFLYPEGVEYERRPATDPCIIWNGQKVWQKEKSLRRKLAELIGR